ncbi:MAG TPA: hypothetical protein VKB17_09255 [Thermoleophilaceae bacterium]|nr:hypothetical protein [Thermoleophilaceae bacterium]
MSDVDVVRAAFASWQRPARVDEASLSVDERRAILADLLDSSFDAGAHPDVE